MEYCEICGARTYRPNYRRGIIMCDDCYIDDKEDEYNQKAEWGKRYDQD